jgi:hypothetical protein
MEEIGWGGGPGQAQISHLRDPSLIRFANFSWSVDMCARESVDALSRAVRVGQLMRSRDIKLLKPIPLKVVARLRALVSRSVCARMFARSCAGQSVSRCVRAWVSSCALARWSVGQSVSKCAYALARDDRSVGQGVYACASLSLLTGGETRAVVSTNLRLEKLGRLSRLSQVGRYASACARAGQ